MDEDALYTDIRHHDSDNVHGFPTPSDGPASPDASSGNSDGTPAGHPQTSPHTPRSMAVDVLKRAASLREGGGGSPSPKTALSPGVARIGLERSTSDAARRLAMAKLTGEKVEIPLEYTTPVQAMPSGPPPSLADLQARHEQRMGLVSPTPSDQYASDALASLSRSTTPGPAVSSPLASSSGHGGDEEEEDRQRRTEERAEARTNLIRKLSRGRLAAGAAAGARERAEAAGSPSPSLSREGSLTSSTSASPLQRRPSLGDALARSASQRQRARAMSPELPSNATALQQQHQYQPLLPPAELQQSELASTPTSLATDSVPESPMAYVDSHLPSISKQRNFDHIPVPPTPETPESMRSPVYSQADGSAGHDSVYSALSSFRPYRHTMERDRDSALARYRMEDNFEYDMSSTGGLSRKGTLQRMREQAGEDDEEILPDTSESVPRAEHPSQHIPSQGPWLSPPDSPLNGRSFPSQSQYAVSSGSELPLSPSHSSKASAGTSYATSQSQRLLQDNYREGNLDLNDDNEAGESGQQGTFNWQSVRQNALFQDHRHQNADTSADPGLPLSRPTSREVEAIAARKRASTGPQADYRFPTPTSTHTSRMHGSRPTSLASVERTEEGLEDSMDRMIDELQSLQAGTAEMRTLEDHAQKRAAGLGMFSHQAHADANCSDAQSTHARTSSASALHDFHETTEEPALHVPHELAADAPISQAVKSQQLSSGMSYSLSASSATSIQDRPADATNTLASVLPIPAATSADYAKYSNSKLAPFPGIHELERQRSSPTVFPSAQVGTGGNDDESAEEQRYRQRDRKFGGALGRFLGKSPQDRTNGQRSQRDMQGDRPPTSDSVPSLDHTDSSASSNASLDRQQPILGGNQPPSNAAKEQIMQRFEDVLTAYKRQNPDGMKTLKTPPRQLLLHAPVLQVVNANTVKDRYLFLFTDILLIAKPIVEEDSNGDPLPITLSTRFLVKSIVELPKLKLTAQAADSAEDPVQKRKHPLLLTFVDRFANDPKKAIAALIAKAGLSNDTSTVANLLFRNPELNRSQLGMYLSSREQKSVLKAYCERLRMGGIRIEDALRVFVGSFRLPNDYSAAEYLLSVFASQWMAANPGSGMTNDSVFATKLVISIMELNDALHSGIDDEIAAAGNLFSFPNSAITVDDFIAAFRLKDPHSALPDDVLTRIYLSIRRDRIQQAADNSIAALAPEIEVVMHPAKMPNRLTYRTASENISLTIPRPDPKLAIRLVGQDLRFEPAVLTFTRSRTATFRITPTSLGSKAMLFVKLGPNCNAYKNIPINKTFAVERAFMNHTFQIAFVNHLSVKRKYLFSMNSAETKYDWVDTLKQRIENAPLEQEGTPKATKIAAAVALQVLRDALLAPEEAPTLILSNKPTFGGRTGFGSPPSSRQGLKSAAGMQRSNSISKTYAHGAGKAESDLNERAIANSSAHLEVAVSMARRGSKDDEKQTSASKTGAEIINIVQQNSLLPLVLGFVSIGAGVDALPRPPVYPSPQSAKAPATSQIVRGTGRFKGL